jgi:protein farnesyltransferase/geranylgeranyltransferase type-1 subunit alpha
MLTFSQWVLQTFGMWEKEMEVIENLLKEDHRNNSVWNHRYFVISKTTPLDRQTKQQEVEYVPFLTDLNSWK